MLPAPHRLRERSDFTSTVRGPGTTRRGSRLLVVHARLADPCDADAAARPARVGFVVSKAVGIAVVRTRVKRRLRAQTAGLVPLLPAGTDLVIRANPAAAEATSAQLRTAIEGCLGPLLRGAPGDRPTRGGTQ